jgi:membrane associated rhomboid family serine protease
VIPLRDDNPTSRFAIVTFAIIALNVLAFVLWEPTFATGQEGEIRQQNFFFCHAMIPYEVTHGETLDQGGADAAEAIAKGFNLSLADARQFQREYGQVCSGKAWWQSIFIAMFLHGGWLHIGGNMLFLWVFGNNVEDKIGRIFYFLFYIAGGLAATLAQVAVGPNSVVPNLGASGAIAAVLGAYLVMFPRRRVLTLVPLLIILIPFYVPAFVVLGLWFVLQLFNGVASMGTQVNAGGGVAFFAHVGGFVFGLAMALLFFPKERFGSAPPPRRPDVWRGRPVRGLGPPPDPWP